MTLEALARRIDDDTLAYDDLEQRSEEWYAVRRGIVTASTVGRLITVGALTAIDYDCPRCSAQADRPCISIARKVGSEPIKSMHIERTVFAQARSATSPVVLTVADNDTSRALTLTLAAERITDNTDATYTSSDMWRGILDEPIARDIYGKWQKVAVEEVGFMVRTINGCRLGYSPDGLVGDKGLIEIKSRLQKNHLDTVLAGRVPPEHMAQIQAGLLVSGRDWCDFLSYCSGMALWPIRVHPDPDWFRVIKAALFEYEENAADIAARYQAAVEGLPTTERIDHETAGITF